MIKIQANAQMSPQFDKKLKFVNDLMAQAGQTLSAGFPAEHASQEVITRAKALNYRYAWPEIAAIPWNWFPRWPIPHKTKSGDFTATQGKEYIGWAFMQRAAARFQEEELPKLLQEWSTAISGETTSRSKIQEFGARLVEMIKQEIIKTTTPPLARATVMRKGHEKPLVDTGEMLNSVSYVIREAGG
jgi:hypothetical protein